MYYNCGLIIKFKQTIGPNGFENMKVEYRTLKEKTAKLGYNIDSNINTSRANRNVINPGKDFGNYTKTFALNGNRQRREIYIPAIIYQKLNYN